MLQMAVGKATKMRVSVSLRNLSHSGCSGEIFHLIFHLAATKVRVRPPVEGFRFTPHNSCGKVLPLAVIKMPVWPSVEVK